MARKQSIFVLADEKLRTGDGSLAALLEVPHTGVYAGCRVLIDILFPASRKREDISKNTSMLLNVWELKSKGGGRYTDAVIYKDVHFHVDGKGVVAYLSVPAEWMKILVREQKP